jgi:hypothetical protein
MEFAKTKNFNGIFFFKKKKEEKTGVFWKSL